MNFKDSTEYRIVKYTNGLDETWYRIQYKWLFAWWELYPNGLRNMYSSYPEAQGVLDRHVSRVKSENRDRRLRSQIKTEVMGR